jgi:DNA-binding CsgD family transcriptional regulator
LVSDYVTDQMVSDNPFITKPEQLQSGLYLPESMRGQGKFHADLDVIENRYNTCPRLYYIHRDRCYIHEYGFGSSEKHKNITSTLINQLPLLKKFIQHFQSEMSLTLQAMFEESIYLEDMLVGKPQKSFLPTIKLDEQKKQKFISQIDNTGNACQFYQLTKREREIFICYSTGKSAREVAKQMHLSPRTIEHHLERIKDKLLCGNKSELYERFQQIKEFLL